jgi:2-dehydro-3-deoxyphosphogluconate aldolase / (4S)-4-hydroxy-2-oxoglutarate aldolase
VSAASFAASLQQHRLIAILRGTDITTMAARVEALHRAGVRLIEVALSDQGASEALAELVRVAPAGMVVGAGTVTSVALAERARALGATFLVTPHLRSEVARYAHDHDLGLLMGALTPTEIADALDAGTKFIKLFPASAFGPSYIQALHGPYPTLDIVAVGGVNAANIADYLAAGALGVGIGGALASPPHPREGFAPLEREAARCVAALSPSPPPARP